MEWISGPAYVRKDHMSATISRTVLKKQIFIKNDTSWSKKSILIHQFILRKIKINQTTFIAPHGSDEHRHKRMWWCDDVMMWW